MRYDYPLVTWINIGLHRDSLNAALESIRAGKSLDQSLTESASSNKQYLEKILREEAIKQFKDAKRPLLEIILNSIDAKPREFDQQYEVEVKVGRRQFSAADNGRGMNPEDILRLLIIPFSSDKSILEYIGMFGVGFISTFNFCLKDIQNKVIVDTSTAEEHTMAEFYATGKTVGDLRMALEYKNRSRKTGTDVTIKARITENNEVIRYIFDQLRGFPTYQARIMVNKVLVNDEGSEGWYSEKTDFKLLGQDLTQETGIKLHSEDDANKRIYLTSQGVNVKNVMSLGRSATISFPPAVQLVEGRDEFKIDTNYRLAVQATFRALEKGIRATEITTKTVREFTELIPSVLSALEMKHLKEIENIDALCSILLPGKRYVMNKTAYKNTKPFFNASFEEYSFPASIEALAYWQELFKGHGALLDDMIIETEASLIPRKFEERLYSNPHAFQNLQLLSVIVGKVNNYYRSIKLVKAPGYGESALYFSEDQDDLCINLLHPQVQGERDPLKIYSILSDYFNHRAARRKHGLKETEDAERKIHSYLRDAVWEPKAWRSPQGS